MFSAQNIRLNVPGSTVVLGLEPMPAMSHGVANQAMRYPSPGDSSVNGTTYFRANTPVMYSYIMMPWTDGTERRVKEYMLVFGSNHVDSRRGLTTVVPIFKLNAILREKGQAFRNDLARGSAKHAQFNGYMGAMGEAILDSYTHALRNYPIVATEMERQNPDLKKYHSMAQEDQFVYLTRFGITSKWRFLGAVVSKGESTSADAYSDVESTTEAIFTVGVSVAKRACVHNLWEGNPQAGTRLFFILSRDEASGVYQYVPYATRLEEYPPLHLRNNVDAAGKFTHAYIECVGFVRESPGGKTDKDSSIVACGLAKDQEAAYMRTPMLPTMWIEIGV